MDYVRASHIQPNEGSYLLYKVCPFNNNVIVNEILE